MSSTSNNELMKVTVLKAVQLYKSLYAQSHYTRVSLCAEFRVFVVYGSNRVHYMIEQKN